MVFQSCALFPHMTVAENMGFAHKMAGVDKLGRVSAKVGAGHDRIEAGQAVACCPTPPGPCASAPTAGWRPDPLTPSSLRSLVPTCPHHDAT